MEMAIPATMIEKFTTFGDFLRFLRRRAGLTQLELSIAVGYSDAQISRLEQNLRLPDLPTIEARFVPALGLDDQPKAISRLLELAANLRREDAPGLGLCPYKGMNYFDEPDADLFVGREGLVARLADRVLSFVSASEDNRSKFVAIVGASGSGKSSLVRAGLVPALRWNQSSANWLIHILTPTAHPLESLAASLTQDAGSVVATATLMDDLAREPRSLSIYGKKRLQSAGADHLLLVIDQFEELFALCRSEEERSAFINNLLAATSTTDERIIAIIVLRADFYAYCSGYPLLREALAREQEYIGAMSNQELRRAIEEPARRGRWEFEPGLVDLLLHEVGHEPGALPLLSHALLETWQRRRGRMLTLSGYASSGGVRGAIAETAEAVFADRFTCEQQAIARRIFLRLTELGDETATGDTRRRASFNELVLKPEDTEATQGVLKALADARLITTKEDSAEVAHEALIREWPKLREWLEDNREGLRLHRHLTEAAKEWEMQNHEPEGLYRGARLAQAREWAANHTDEINALEREFLDTSQAWAEREEKEREHQRQRELEAAQKLAKAEKQRAVVESQRAEEQARAARQLRQRALYLAGALVFAVGMVFVTLFFGAQARQAAIDALNQQRVASSRELAAAAISNLEVDPERSILLAMQAVSMTYSLDKTWTVEAEDALRRGLETSRIELTLRGHTGIIAGIAFSPDGRRLATASDDGTVKIWDASIGLALLTLPVKDTYGQHGLAFSPDGKRLATSGNQGVAKVWDAATGQELLTLSGHQDKVNNVAFSPDGRRLFTASEDRTAKIWDARTGQVLLTLTGHTGPIFGIAFNPNGTRLATTSEDAKVKLWDARTGREIQTLSGHLGEVYTVSFSPDGKRLATASQDGTAKIWETETGKEILTLRGHTDWVTSVAFSPDGKRLATASFDQKTIIWDTRTGQELLALTGHTGPVPSLAFSPDGTRLATASFDETAKVWNVSLSRELLSLYFPEASAIAFSPDGSRLAIGDNDGIIKLWEVNPDERRQASKVREILNFRGHSGAVNRIVFSPDGTRLATVSEDQTIKVWDAERGREAFSFRGHTAGVFSVVFSSEGTHLATASADYTVKVWDLTTGSAQAVLTIPIRPQNAALAFNPVRNSLAIAMSDGTVKVWDLEVGKESLFFQGHTDEIWGITYSPDGKSILTASLDGTAKAWDSASGQALYTLKGHIAGINQVAFSPKGTRLVTGSLDGAIKVWDAVSGQELITLRRNGESLKVIDFSQDESLLLTASVGGAVRYHLLRMDDLLALARRRVTRGLTVSECQQYLHQSREKCAEEFSELRITATTTPVLEQKQAAHLKPIVCEVTDETGINDQFFNQVAYQGVLEASKRFGWESAFVESKQPAEVDNHLTEFIHLGCDLIVIPGGLRMADQVRAAAEAHPGQKFQIIESLFHSTSKNVWQQWYATDQAAFIAGYVAAAVSRTGKVGIFGGINIPLVTDFMDGFTLGVEYHNEKNGTNVEVIGWDVEKQDGLFTGNFVRMDDGRRMAEQLLGDGTDIIFPVAGSVGLGAAAVVREKGNAFLIGVDTDWSVTYPEYADLILTSIQKRLDVSVVSAVQAIVDGKYTGGTHVGTLENGGVDIAPFHHLDELVSLKVKADLEQIKADIAAGKIKTRPGAR